MTVPASASLAHHLHHWHDTTCANFCASHWLFRFVSSALPVLHTFSMHFGDNWQRYLYFDNDCHFTLFKTIFHLRVSRRFTWQLLIGRFASLNDRRLNVLVEICDLSCMLREMHVITLTNLIYIYITEPLPSHRHYLVLAVAIFISVL